jgi:hypothetical protein
MTAETLPRCPHGIYQPKGQKFAHGCYQCNPALAAPDDNPQKTEALFKLENGAALREVRIYPYQAVFVLGTPMGVRRVSSFGGLWRHRYPDVFEPVRVSFRPGIKSEFQGLRRDWRW